MTSTVCPKNLEWSKLNFYYLFICKMLKQVGLLSFFRTFLCYFFLNSNVYGVTPGWIALLNMTFLMFDFARYLSWFSRNCTSKLSDVWILSLLSTFQKPLEIWSKNKHNVPAFFKQIHNKDLWNSISNFWDILYSY